MITYLARSTAALGAALVLALTTSSMAGPAASAAPSASAAAAPRTQVVRVVEVVSGELVRVRVGNGRPFLIRQAGVAVPDNRCRARAAKKALSKTLKRDRRLVAVMPAGVPARDGAGRRQAFLGIEVNGKVGSLGLAQIASGNAWAATGYDYPFKKRYLKVAAAAKKAGVGYHGTC